MRKLLLVKLFLCANPYLIVFFPMLQANGLSSPEILSAISIGTIVMIAGDGMTSYFVDKFGPKRPVIAASFIQALTILLLSVCSTYELLILFEILMGLSFPAIYGADSKWLKMLAPSDNNREKLNQNIFWVSQLVSAVLGCLLLHFPVFLCIFNALLYMIGAFLCLKLEDAARSGSARYSIQSHSFKLTESWKSIFIYGFLMGSVAISSWFLQAESSKYTHSLYLFSFLQIAGSILSLTGSLIKANIQKIWIALALSSILLYPVFGLSGWSYGIWLAIGIGLLARGAIGVLSRNKVLGALDSSGPVATVNFFLGGWAKVVQALLLLGLSSFK